MLYFPFSEATPSRPARSKSTSVGAFSGVGGTYPIPSSGFGLPGRSCAAWVWFRAFLVGNGDAGQLCRLAVGLPLGVQPVGFPPALSVDVRHGLGKPLFPAKPLFAAFQRARCWMRVQAVELPPARRAAPGRCLATGQPFLSGHRPR